MATEARIRASDADRDRDAAALREHLAAGRLTIEEFDERLNRVYAAKTLGELDEIMADLPVTDLDRLPGDSLDHPAGGQPPAGPRARWPIEAGRGPFYPAWRAAWGSWLAISLLLFMIWLVSGASGGLWFLWVALPLGALMLGRWVAGAPARRPARPRHDHGRHYRH